MVARFVKLSLLLVVAAVVGCGGRSASVSGVVTVDGKPLEQGTVAFAPVAGGMRASGIIESDGSYTIRTNRDKGLDVGEYNVAVVSREFVRPEGSTGAPMPGKYLAPKRYGRPTTSGLQFQVEKGSNTINLELTSDKR